MSIQDNATKLMGMIRAHAERRGHDLAGGLRGAIFIHDQMRSSFDEPNDYHVALAYLRDQGALYIMKEHDLGVIVRIAKS